ncbi:hypothetical protein, partial [Snodgrassella sp.]|uniref:hypothetical protein n=1 Tax=Snodgrassella sp. TaxID=2815304 RepID=UPI00258871C5
MVIPGVHFARNAAAPQVAPPIAFFTDFIVINAIGTWNTATANTATTQVFIVVFICLYRRSIHAVFTRGDANKGLKTASTAT